MKTIINTILKILAAFGMRYEIRSNAKKEVELENYRKEEKAREKIRSIHNRVVNDAGLRKHIKDKFVK